jgi:hypothetical protein
MSRTKKSTKSEKSTWYTDHMLIRADRMPIDKFSKKYFGDWHRHHTNFDNEHGFGFRWVYSKQVHSAHKTYIANGTLPETESVTVSCKTSKNKKLPVNKHIPERYKNFPKFICIVCSTSMLQELHLSATCGCEFHHGCQEKNIRCKCDQRVSLKKCVRWEHYSDRPLVVIWSKLIIILPHVLAKIVFDYYL